MKPQTIKAKLVKRGIRQTDIAECLSISRAAVNGVIAGSWRSERVERAIAQKLNMPHNRVFPKGHKK